MAFTQRKWQPSTGNLLEGLSSCNVGGKPHSEMANLFHVYFMCLAERSSSNRSVVCAETIDLIDIFLDSAIHYMDDKMYHQLDVESTLTKSRDGDAVAKELFDAHETGIISLRGLQLGMVPWEVCHMELLTEINLEENNLDFLPSGLKSLKNLQKLILDKNNLVRLPAQIGQLKELRILSVSHNKLANFPCAALQLRGLHQLHLHHNKISRVPTAVMWMKSLRELTLHNNLITFFPNTIGWNSSLKKLTLNDNYLEEIPTTLSRLNLSYLTLDNNPLQPLQVHLLGLSPADTLNAVQQLGNMFDNVRLNDIATFAEYRKQNFQTAEALTNTRKPLSKADKQLVQAIQIGDVNAMRQCLEKAGVSPHHVLPCSSSFPVIQAGDTAARLAQRLAQNSITEYIYGYKKRVTRLPPTEIWNEIFHVLVEETESFFTTADLDAMQSALMAYEDLKAGDMFYSELGKSFRTYLEAKDITATLVLPTGRAGQGNLSMVGSDGGLHCCTCAYHMSSAGKSNDTLDGLGFRIEFATSPDAYVMNLRGSKDKSKGKSSKGKRSNNKASKEESSSSSGGKKSRSLKNSNKTSDTPGSSLGSSSERDSLAAKRKSLKSFGSEKDLGFRDDYALTLSSSYGLNKSGTRRLSPDDPSAMSIHKAFLEMLRRMGDAYDVNYHLLLACKHGERDMAMYLLEKQGASQSYVLDRNCARDGFVAGDTPVSVAKRYGHAPCAAVVQSKANKIVGDIIEKQYQAPAVGKPIGFMGLSTGNAGKIPMQKSAEITVASSSSSKTSSNESSANNSRSPPNVSIPSLNMKKKSSLTILPGLVSKDKDKDKSQTAPIDARSNKRKSTMFAVESGIPSDSPSPTSPESISPTARKGTGDAGPTAWSPHLEKTKSAENNLALEYILAKERGTGLKKREKPIKEIAGVKGSLAIPDKVSRATSPTTKKNPVFGRASQRSTAASDRSSALSLSSRLRPTSPGQGLRQSNLNSNSMRASINDRTLKSQADASGNLKIKKKKKGVKSKKSKGDKPDRGKGDSFLDKSREDFDRFGDADESLACRTHELMAKMVSLSSPDFCILTCMTSPVYEALYRVYLQLIVAFGNSRILKENIELEVRHDFAAQKVNKMVAQTFDLIKELPKNQTLMSRFDNAIMQYCMSTGYKKTVVQAEMMLMQSGMIKAGDKYTSQLKGSARVERNVFSALGDGPSRSRQTATENVSSSIAEMNTRKRSDAVVPRPSFLTQPNGVGVSKSVSPVSTRDMSVNQEEMRYSGGVIIAGAAERVDTDSRPPSPDVDEEGYFVRPIEISDQLRDEDILAAYTGQFPESANMPASPTETDSTLPLSGQNDLQSNSVTNAFSDDSVETPVRSDTKERGTPSEDLQQKGSSGISPSSGSFSPGSGENEQVDVLAMYQGGFPPPNEDEDEDEDDEGENEGGGEVVVSQITPDNDIMAMYGLDTGEGPEVQWENSSAVEIQGSTTEDILAMYANNFDKEGRDIPAAKNTTKISFVNTLEIPTAPSSGKSSVESRTPALEGPESPDSPTTSGPGVMDMRRSQGQGQGQGQASFLQPRVPMKSSVNTVKNADVFVLKKKVSTGQVPEQYMRHHYEESKERIAPAGEQEEPVFDPRGHVVGKFKPEKGGANATETLGVKVRGDAGMEASFWAERGWNERFQAIYDHLHDAMAGGVNDLLALRQKSADFLALAQDFIYTAKTYGRIIILERYSNNKTISPVKIGGLAGGQKYIVNEVLFKFATDTQGIFDNDDYAASKVAGHDLKGLMAYLSCGIPELRVPLMAVVDFLGFRLTAMSMLPIDPQTLVYGTGDGGRKILNSDANMSAMMEITAKRLNLRPHICGLKSQAKMLYSAADVEGHKGRDGRYYIIDFSRTFPPTEPDNRYPCGHLYQLFRPEFLAQYSTSLCPDAYSGFIREDPNRKEYNSSVVAATQHLIQKAIPPLVTNLENLLNDEKDLENFHVSEQLHKAGINMRYIGHALRRASDRKCYIMLLIEAMARVLKNELRAQLRATAMKLKVPVMGPYRHLIVDFMNCTFGSSHGSEIFWKRVVIHRLRKYFNVDCDDDEDLQAILSKEVPNAQVAARYFLFLRVQHLTNLKFDESAIMKLKAPNVHPRPFDLMHLTRLGVDVKHTATVTNAEGNFIFAKVLDLLRDGAVEEALQQLQKAKGKYEQSLISSPNNKEALLQIARTCRRILEVEAYLASGEQRDAWELEGVLASTTFSMIEPPVLQVETYFLRTMEVDPADPLIKFLYGCFLLQGRQLVSAHEIFLDLVECHPDHPEYLAALGFLLASHNIDKSHFFLARATLSLTLRDLQQDTLQIKEGRKTMGDAQWHSVRSKSPNRKRLSPD